MPLASLWSSAARCSKLNPHLTVTRRTIPPIPTPATRTQIQVALRTIRAALETADVRVPTPPPTDGTAARALPRPATPAATRFPRPRDTATIVIATAAHGATRLHVGGISPPIAGNVGGRAWTVTVATEMVVGSGKGKKRGRGTVVRVRHRPRPHRRRPRPALVEDGGRVAGRTTRPPAGAGRTTSTTVTARASGIGTGSGGGGTREIGITTARGSGDGGPCRGIGMADGELCGLGVRRRQGETCV